MNPAVAPAEGQEEAAGSPKHGYDRQVIIPVHTQSQPSHLYGRAEWNRWQKFLIWDSLAMVLYLHCPGLFYFSLKFFRTTKTSSSKFKNGIVPGLNFYRV